MDVRFANRNSGEQAWLPAQAICRLVRSSRGGSEPVLSSISSPQATHRLDHVRGLIFEPANVFYDDTLWRRWLLKQLTRMGLHTHYQVFFGIWQSEYLSRVHRGETPFLRALQEFLAAARFISGQIEELLTAAKAQRNRFECEHRLLPGVARALAALRGGGIHLAVSADSAFTAAEIAAKLDRLGLAGLFCGVVSSLDLRRTKPDTECYQAALDLLRMVPGEAAFVSCHADHLAAAERYGLTAIAHRCPVSDEQAARIERFEQLPGFFSAESANRLAG